MIGDAVRSNILSQHITFAILADGRPSIALVAPAFLACALFAYEVVRLAHVYFLGCYLHSRWITAIHPSHPTGPGS